jgi:hypothetical protein
VRIVKDFLLPPDELVPRDSGPMLRSASRSMGRPILRDAALRAAPQDEGEMLSRAASISSSAPPSGAACPIAAVHAARAHDTMK